MMDKTQEGKRRFMQGDIVKAVPEHPRAGDRGSVELFYGGDRFGVDLGDGISGNVKVYTTFWGEDLILISKGES